MTDIIKKLDDFHTSMVNNINPVAKTSLKNDKHEPKSSQRHDLIARMPMILRETLWIRSKYHHNFFSSYTSFNSRRQTRFGRSSARSGKLTGIDKPEKTCSKKQALTQRVFVLLRSFGFF